MQRAKGVRLWLEARKGREPVYVIRDGARKISTGCHDNDLSGANEALAAYLARTISPNTRERDPARISCAEVLMLYARDIAPSRPSAATIGYHMKALMPFWGDKMLGQVRRSACGKYTGQRGVSPSTCRGELKTLQAAINYWHGESPLVAVPRVSLPDEAPPRTRVLERREVAAMLWACRRLKLPHVARFILIGLYTGTRHAAILELKWLPDFHGGHCDVERGILYRRGHGERETSKRRPPVQIPGRLLHFMGNWKAHDQDRGASHVITYGGARIAKMKRAWAHVIREAGLGKDVTPHILRHTCASWNLWAGRTIWDVAGLIGADASTVERVYGHHRLEQRPERKRA